MAIYQGYSWGYLDAPFLLLVDRRVTGWWLNQPIWKIWVKLDHFPKVRGEHKKYLKPPPIGKYQQDLILVEGFSSSFHLPPAQRSTMSGEPPEPTISSPGNSCGQPTCVDPATQRVDVLLEQTSKNGNGHGNLETFLGGGCVKIRGKVRWYDGLYGNRWPLVAVNSATWQIN